jgi:hypothetical protein
MTWTVDITPDDLVELLVRERNWLGLFLAVSQARIQLQTAKARTVAAETIEALVRLRAAQLRN